nr:hypothetical protein [uncultured Draconibacterium sp.]
MKKILHLFIIGFLVFSCSKDETEDNSDFDVSSDYYFVATIDDNTIVFQHGIDGYYNGTTSGFTTTPSGYQEDYGTVFMNGFTTANSAGIFFSKTFSEPGNCSDMV